MSRLRSRSRSPPSQNKDWTLIRPFEAGIAAMIEIKTQFKFEGAAKIRLIKGTASIYGRKLQLNEWLQVVNDSSRMQITLPIVNTQKDASCQIEVECYKEYSLSEKMHVISADNIGVVNLQAITETQVNIFQSDQSWVRPLDKINSCDVIVVVGPPNCGKSTYIGYLANQLASRNITKINYIEADCGQPNFNQLPGQLSLLKLDMQNSIQPQITIQKQIFYNSADPAHDPELNIESILSLLHFATQDKNSKLIINTCGWVDGLGAHILQQLFLNLPSSAQVVQLTSGKISELNFQNMWMTQIKGELSQNSIHQKGSSVRNKRIWDYLCGHRPWCVQRLERLAPSRSFNYKHKNLEEFNLQLVAGIDNQNQLKWIGFVSDICLKTEQLQVITQTNELTCQKIILCCSKLFSVPSNLLFRAEQQDDYLGYLMRQKVRKGFKQEAYLLAEMI